MAKMQESPNKSDRIRGYLKQNKGASVAEIVNGLKSQGVTVSPALASKIKYDRNRGSQRRSTNGRRAINKAVSKAPSASGLNIDDLVATKCFADQIGGLDVLRSSLDALEVLSKSAT